MPQSQCGGPGHPNEVWDPVACNLQPGCCYVDFNPLDPNDDFKRPGVAGGCRGGGETWKAGPCPQP